MRWQAQMLSYLRASHVEHGGFDSAHRSLASTHVKDGGRASPDDRGSGLRELMNRNAADAFGGVLNDGTGQRDRRGRSGQGHADDFGWNSCASEIDKILRSKFRPV